MRAPVSGKTSAKRWAEARETEVITLARLGLGAEAIRARLNGTEAANEPRVPTLAEFGIGSSSTRSVRHVVFGTHSRLCRPDLRQPALRPLQILRELVPALVLSVPLYD